MQMIFKVLEYILLGVAGLAAVFAVIVTPVLCAVSPAYRSRVKEFFRKKIVALKRAPKIIPIVFMFITFLYYALNLTTISNTTATANTTGMGLSEFCIMLFSLLSMVCVLNAFPHRKKPVIPMIVLLFVMFGIVIFCDTYYIGAIGRSTADAYRASTFVDETGKVISKAAKNEYILDAAVILKVHIILESISALLVATLPLYGKLIRKIKTSVDVEDNGSMDAIEIEE